MATACEPDEQNRLTVVPGTLTGRSAAMAAIRAMFMPITPSGWPQPTMQSAISSGSRPSAAFTVSRIVCAR